MTDRTLPAWLRLVLLFTGLLQAVLGITLLLNPAAINGLWPWPIRLAKMLALPQAKVKPSGP